MGMPLHTCHDDCSKRITPFIKWWEFIFYIKAKTVQYKIMLPPSDN